MKKTAVEVREITGTPGSMLASTVGRVGAVPGALLLQPQAPIQFLNNPDKDKVQEIADAMHRAYGKDLDHVAVRIGGTDTADDMRRAVVNPNTTLLQKTLFSFSLPISNMMANLRRGDHYNPTSDVINLYSGNPYIAAHELGHAADYNIKSKGERAVYTGAGLGSDRLLGPLSPLTQWKELLANKRGLEGLDRGVADPVERDQHKRDYWKILAPAYATYATSAVGGGLALHNRLAGGGPNTPLNKILNTSSAIIAKYFGAGAAQRYHRPAALLSMLGAGVATGHAVGAIRNALTPRPGKKEDNDMLTKKAYYVGARAALEKFALTAEDIETLEHGDRITPAMGAAGGGLAMAGVSPFFGALGAGMASGIHSPRGYGARSALGTGIGTLAGQVGGTIAGGVGGAAVGTLIGGALQLAGVPHAMLSATALGTGVGALGGLAYGGYEGARLGRQLSKPDSHVAAQAGYAAEKAPAR